MSPEQRWSKAVEQVVVNVQRACKGKGQSRRGQSSNGNGKHVDEQSEVFWRVAWLTKMMLFRVW